MIRMPPVTPTTPTTMTRRSERAWHICRQRINVVPRAAAVALRAVVALEQIVHEVCTQATVAARVSRVWTRVVALGEGVWRGRWRVWRRGRGRARWERRLRGIGVCQRSVGDVSSRTVVTVGRIATDGKIVSRRVRSEVSGSWASVLTLPVAGRGTRVVSDGRVVADVGAVPTELDLCNNGRHTPLSPVQGGVEGCVC